MSSIKCIVVVLFFIATQVAMAQIEQVSRRTPVVEVVEKVGPSIVNISTERIVKTPYSSIAEDFFDRYDTRAYKTRSLGSGVIVDSSGFIVTNDHVIRQASRIVVTLSNKKNFVASVLASDGRNDLAILKIEAGEPLVSIRWGSSEDLMIGETAIALGNPFGLSNTVTTGVVSATDRAISIEGKVNFRDFIQSDVAINPGNSGGALLNLHGELIGINTAIYSKGQGLGFAIPAKRVREVIGELLDYRKTKGIWVGLTVQETLKEQKDWLVLVHEVLLNSPAMKAGLKRGDILISADGVPIRSTFDFKKALYVKRPGLTVALRISSGGQIKNATLSLGTLPVALAHPVLWTKIGLVLDAQSGVPVVNKVRPNSPASRIGMAVGDIVASLSGQSFGSLFEMEEFLQNMPAKTPLGIIVVRQGKQLSGELVLD